jgi:hypothetical protein
MGAYFDIAMSFVASHQVCVVRYNPMIADYSTTFNSGEEPSTPPVHGVAIWNNNCLSASWFREVAYARTYFFVLVDTATVGFTIVATWMQHVFNY